jgi:hypothetical protein
MVNKDFKTTVSVRIKDGTRTFVEPFKDEIEHNGTGSDPELVIKALQSAITQVKAEASQTTLDVTDAKKDLHTGSPEAKDAAKKVNEGKKEPAKK